MNDAPPCVPDHELLRPIGRGAYGEVWLAVNVMGAGRAVKIVRRASFENERPFEREFAAVKRYEPVSRSADGLVNVLHAGRAADDALFYYVMELADAADGGEFSRERAAEYRPRTLRAAVEAMGGRLPLAECLGWAHSLTQALASLHAAGLTHRDIKPSNIIFVHHRPKLADIGLVGAAGETRSFVGTEGYIPPEGPGQPGADLYALGMVCYGMATGCSPEDFPQVPAEWTEPGGATAMEFMEIIVRATEASAERRYQSALEMLADLAVLQSGGSVRRLRLLEQRWRRVKRTLPAAAAALALAGGGFWFQQNEKLREARTAAAEARSVEARSSEREQRFLALRERAAASLRSPLAGARGETLRAIGEAAALHPQDAALRDLLVTTLTRADYSEGKIWTHADPFMAPVVSPDGRLVALVEKDGGIRIESTADGSVVHRLPAWPGTRPWSRWRFTPDGAFLGVDYGSSNAPAQARFRWWRLSDSTMAWEGAPGVVSLGGVPAQGSVIAAWDAHAGVLVRYDLAARRETERRSLTVKANDFVLSPDGTRAVFFQGGTDFVKGATFVDLDNGITLREVELDFMNRAVAWLPHGRQAVFGGAYPPHAALIVSATETTAPPRVLRLHAGPVVDVAVSADGQFLLTGSWDQTTRLTHLAADAPLALAAGWGGNGSAGFATDGRHCWRAVVQGPGRSPALHFCPFHLPLAAAVVTTADEQKIERPYFSPDNSLLLAAGTSLTVYDLHSRRTQSLLPGADVQACAFIREGNREALLCGCSGGLFRVRRDAGGAWQPGKLLAHGDYDELASARDGQFAVAYGFNTRSHSFWSGLRLPWPAEQGIVSASLCQDGAPGAYTVAGGNRVTLQNKDGSTRATLPVPDKTWISLSPDGRRLFLSEPAAVRCVDTADLREVWRVEKEFPSVRSAPFPFAGGRLLLAKTGLHYALLDAATGAVRCRLETAFPFHGPHGAVSPDGRHLAMASSHCLLLWDLAALRGELRRHGMDWEE